jgi:hypothetical protein
MPEEPTRPAAPEVKTTVSSAGATGAAQERETAINAAPVSPPPATFLDWSGHKLATGSLIGLFAVIGAFLVILSSGWGCGSCGVELPTMEAKQVLADCLNPKLTGDDYSKVCPATKVDMAKLVISEPNVTAYREFWKSMFERVVGTTLLPIVTAILGYLFASNNRGNPSKPADSSGQPSA